MSEFNRRDFVFLSSGAAIGNMLVSGTSPAAQDDGNKGLDFSQSGLRTGNPKPLKHKSIPGFLSEEQIAPHHTAHYGGALRGYFAADARIEASFKSDEVVDPDAYGALKRTINSKGNSVVLHEMYFDGIVPQPPDPTPRIRGAIDHVSVQWKNGRMTSSTRPNRPPVGRCSSIIQSTENFTTS